MLLSSPSLLVISDIHYGQLAEYEDLGSKGHVKDGSYKQLADSVQSALSENFLKPTILIVPGDLTSVGSPYEFKQSSEVIKHVADALLVDEEKIIITYGNHDIDWKIGNLSKDIGISRELYCEFAAMCGSVFAPGSKPTVAGPCQGCGLYQYPDLTVIVLNSGLKCYPKHEEDKGHYPHGSIDQDQLNWLAQLDNRVFEVDHPKVLILHHHLVNIPYPAYSPDISALEEAAEVIKLLGERGIDMVIHGHRHHPAVFTTTQGGWKNPITFLCAGSFGVNSHHRVSGMIPNTFHHIEFSGKTPEGNSSGTIWTFERTITGGWNQVKDGSEVLALDGRQHFGSVSSMPAIESALDYMLELAINSNPDKHVVLPDYSKLELCLRSLRYHDLHQYLVSRAKILGAKITGKYPDECLLTKLS